MLNTWADNKSLSWQDGISNDSQCKATHSFTLSYGLYQLSVLITYWYKSARGRKGSQFIKVVVSKDPNTFAYIEFLYIILIMKIYRKCTQLWFYLL